jgi:RNA polymerase sigma-70 factor (ECF subfamily)
MDSGPNDGDLVAEAKLGSCTAFNLLMQRYERLVYRISWAYTRDRDDALDLTQDVFLRAWEKLGTFRGEGSFRGWLLCLAHRTGLNRLRSRRRTGQRNGLVTGDLPCCPADQETDLLRREEQERLLEELARLNPRQQLAVTLRYFERRPLRDIALALTCSEGTAKNLLFRSLDKLRRGLLPREREHHERMPALPGVDEKLAGG